MNTNTKAILVVFLIIVGLYLWATPAEPGKLDAFARCVRDSGTRFYGTFWCPYCRNQKAMFGTSAKSLPYIECSTPDGKGELPVCADAGVKSYPTWILPDGTKHERELSLENLSSATRCSLSEVAP